MAGRVSPYIDNTGLVFAYDLANTVRSYPGELTVNLVNPSWSAWSVDGSGQGTIGTRTLLSNYHCRIVDISANTRQYIYVEGVSANTQYTFSVKFLKLSGAPTLRFQLQAYNGGSYISAWFPTTVEIGLADIDGWQTAKYTVTTPANTTRVLWFMQDGDDYTTYTHSFELKEPQAEAKTHTTPFVAGTRSATQALKDLTGRSTIDLSNVSFDSNAQMTFDGTNDYVTLPTGLLDGTGDFTVEAVVRADASEIGGTVFGNYPAGELQVFFGTRFIGLYLANASTYLGTSPWSTTLPEFTTKPVHILTMRSGTTTTFYINGELKKTGSSSSSIGSTSAAFRVGTNTGTSEQFTGDIKLLRVYNRALTASEIQQNFNAVKGRYGI